MNKKFIDLMHFIDFIKQYFGQKLPKTETLRLKCWAWTCSKSIITLWIFFYTPYIWLICWEPIFENLFEIGVPLIYIYIYIYIYHHLDTFPKFSCFSTWKPSLLIDITVWFWECLTVGIHNSSSYGLTFLKKPLH